MEALCPQPMYKTLLSFNVHFLAKESGSLTQGLDPGLLSSHFLS